MYSKHNLNTKRYELQLSVHSACATHKWGCPVLGRDLLLNEEFLPRSPSIASFRKGKDARANLTPGIPSVLPRELKPNACLTTHTPRSFSLFGRRYHCSGWNVSTWPLDRLYCVSWEHQIQKATLGAVCPLFCGLNGKLWLEAADLVEFQGPRLWSWEEERVVLLQSSYSWIIQEARDDVFFSFSF